MLYISVFELLVFHTVLSAFYFMEDSCFFFFYIELVFKIMKAQK